MCKTTDATQCVHCHLCQENCSFLKKYHIDIGNTDKLYELAYHCFLCGKCTRVCPIGIDGREIVRDMRRNQVKKDYGEYVNKKYKRVISEKKDYSYRNYRHATEHSVFFPGCNFPSVYPKTAKKLAELLNQAEGIGTIYDCCGKPISDLGMEEQEQAEIVGLEKRLQEAKITEIITACPNCYEYLTPRISVKVTDIYEKLQELGIGQRIEGGCEMFVPCPDKEQRIWLEHIRAFLKNECREIEDIQCCGLGGNAGALEPELSKGFASALKDTADTVYTYCGSCAGHLTRNGCKKVRHILPEILGTDEKPDTVKSLINRMKTKYL